MAKDSISQEQKRTKELQKKMIEAMEKSFGVVTTACKAAGIGRTAYYRWMNEDAEFKSAIDSLDCGNIALDFAESKLYKHINDNDKTSLIFYLKTKGKHRGYVERYEHTGAEGRPIELVINAPDEKTKEIINKLSAL